MVSILMDEALGLYCFCLVLGGGWPLRPIPSPLDLDFSRAVLFRLCKAPLPRDYAHTLCSSPVCR